MTADLHRSIPEDMDIDRVLCIKAKRVLRNDFTISYNGKLYQIEDTIRARDVIVEEKQPQNRKDYGSAFSLRALRLNILHQSGEHCTLANSLIQKKIFSLY